MLTYFVQVNVCWLLFYGAYFALLSRETFFRLNRYWLIISLLGGLILPLIAPSLEVVEPTTMAAVLLEPFVVTAENLSQNLQNTEGVVFKLLTAIYLLGVVITLIKLLIGFWKIKRLLHRAERFPMDDFTLMQVREAIAPFSFFRWVFINLNLVESADLQQIILHEQAHVRERHSVDVVFVEVLSVVFWWSPLVYFYTKSLKNVHEYAADAAVLRTSTPPQYGRLLLRQQQSGMSLSLTNPFFSQLKKRILMMTRNPSKRRALVKYALAVPIFLVLTLLLASPKTQVMATTEAATDKVVASIETFEKKWATTEHVDNEVITPNGLAKLLNDTVIAETPQLVFTVDGKTPSSQQVMSLQDIHNRNEFSMSASAKTDKGKLQRVKMIGLTVVRISLKSGTTQASNTSMVFTADMKKLVQMAEIGDTYQFIGKGKLANDDKIQDYTFTYYIGERPTQPRLDALDAQQQADLVKISENPVVLLAGKRGGIITAEDLTKQDKLEAYQVVNGKNIPVNIQSFVMFRAIAGGQEVMQSNNTGGQFSPETKRMIAMASKNDSYQFMDVQCKIQSGIDAVNAGSLTFVVKNAANPQGMAIADGLFVSLEDETGNALYLTEKALKIKELAAPYNKLKIVQMTSGIPHQLEVEEFIIIRIREKENPIRIRNNGSKFNNEVAQIFKDATDGDMFQIMNMRTIEKAPKIAARTWTIEKAPPQYSAAKDTSDPVFTIVEEMAEFVGGLDSMFRFLGRNIHYPPEARTLKVEGTIYIGFIVEKDGSLTNFKVKRNLPESVIETVKVLSVDGGVTGSKVVKRQDQSCATEAIRVLSLMPKWKAAKSKGVPVRVAYTLPIKFKLE